jgi:hypothetical protein
VPAPVAPDPPTTPADGGALAGGGELPGAASPAPLWALGDGEEAVDGASVEPVEEAASVEPVEAPASVEPVEAGASVEPPEDPACAGAVELELSPSPAGLEASGEVAPARAAGPAASERDGRSLLSVSAARASAPELKLRKRRLVGGIETM